jgi:hypothetical protein
MAVDEFEPSLLPPSMRLLRRFAAPGRERDYVAYLEERIRRDPRNLRAHVERVEQRAALGDAGALYAALVDLNIALGVHGRSLRGRLLTQFAGSLRSDERAFLESGLRSGIDAADPRAAVTGSLLSQQVAGTTRLVSRRGVAAAGPGELAREACASGDEAAACLLLEEALEFDPGQRELAAELLALYRRSGRRADFERTRTRLLGQRVALADEWEGTDAWFREQDPGRGD